MNFAKVANEAWRGAEKNERRDKYPRESLIKGALPEIKCLRIVLCKTEAHSERPIKIRLRCQQIKWYSAENDEKQKADDNHLIRLRTYVGLVRRANIMLFFRVTTIITM